MGTDNTHWRYGTRGRTWSDSQMRRGLDHPSRRARRADVTAHAAEGDQEVVAAAVAVRPGEAVGQDAAAQVLAEGLLDVEGDARGEVLIMAGSGDVGLEVFADGAVQEGGRRPAWAVQRRSCGQVALAAGYHNVRRFNAAIRDALGAVIDQVISY